MYHMYIPPHDPRRALLVGTLECFNAGARRYRVLLSRRHAAKPIHGAPLHGNHVECLE